MYDYFNGKIENLTPTNVTIDCNGVGYLLQISLYTYTAIKDVKQFKLFAHQVVREDAHLLFGFSDEDERLMFRELLNVSGVGASTARIIQSSLAPDQLRSVISKGDAVTLQKVKGIGAKSAQRIIIDLQDKVNKLSPNSTTILSSLHNTSREEALIALMTLGFARSSAEKALLSAQKQVGSDAKVEDLIKASLNYL
jgi:Holliday junction DNA helicase RuvA